jgi:hypothetical protein
MDRLKRFALKRTVDGLDKVLEAKAHFDKREEKKTYTKKIISLKETLTDLMFHGEENEKTEAYQKVQLLNRMQTEHELSNQDKRTLDEMVKKYKV